MRGIERAAACVPAPSDGRRRVAAWDEDAFTLVATALERLEAAGPDGGRFDRVVLAGDLGRGIEELVGRFLGYPVPVERAGAGAPGRAAAIRSALDDGPGTSVAVLAADLDRTGPGGVPGAVSDSAVALAIGDAGAVEARSLALEGPPGPREANGPIFGTVGPLAAGQRGRWPGEWTFDPTHGPMPHGRGEVPGPPATGTPVSQGAYVPRPSYLDRLASRWRFAAHRCRACRALTFPVRERCRACGSDGEGDPVRLPVEEVRVVASTVIRPGGQPTEFDEQVAALGPYGVVLLDLADGIRVTVPVAGGGPDPLPIGAVVATRLRRLYAMEGEWRYGRKALPPPG